MKAERMSINQFDLDGKNMPNTELQQLRRTKYKMLPLFDHDEHFDEEVEQEHKNDRDNDDRRTQRVANLSLFSYTVFLVLEIKL